MSRSDGRSNLPLRLLAAGVLALAALAALRGAFAGAWIFDDYSLLALPRFFDNPLLPFWHEHVEGGLHYRPMGLLLWWISERLFGAQPLPHYLLNGVLLAAVVLALWRLLAHVTRRERLAFALALAFAVHPVAIGTAAWLSNRYELLAALFGLSALAAAWRFRQTRSAGALAGSLILFACALAAKENTLALIAAACVFWCWPTQSRQAWFGRHQLACLWLLALVAMWLLVRQSVLSTHGADALFAHKPALQLFRDGMTAWSLKLTSYIALAPRLGRVTGPMFVLGAIGLVVLAARGAFPAWSRDRVAAMLGGLSLVVVAAFVQWPRTGLVLMNLQFGTDTFNDVLASRYYFMAALGFVLMLAALLATAADHRASRRLRWLAPVTLLLLLVPLFSVSQHIARSYRGVTLAQNVFAEAAVAAIDKFDLPAHDCQIYLLDSNSPLFRFYADPAVKALTSRLERVSSCFVQGESAPWYHLVDVGQIARAQSAPFTPVRVGDGTLEPVVLGRGALLFLNLAPGAQVPLGPGSVFLAWRDGAFVDVGDDVRAGRRRIEFTCFRSASQCP